MKKPNLRRIIIPDSGYRMYDSDLAQADAQIVAWDANDESLMEFFKNARRDPTLDLHTENASVLKCSRQQAKAGVHATNYGATPHTLARRLGVTQRDAEEFQRRWFSANPAIRDWHRRIDDALNTTRTISNQFGYSITYFGRPEQLLPEALAWIPQSTVALVADKAFVNLDENMYPRVVTLMQNHDSLVYQIKRDIICAEILNEVKDNLHVAIPYDDPLVIPWGLSYSDRSWGDLRDMEWPEAA